MQNLFVRPHLSRFCIVSRHVSLVCLWMWLIPCDLSHDLWAWPMWSHDRSHGNGHTPPPTPPSGHCVIIVPKNPYLLSLNILGISSENAWNPLILEKSYYCSDCDIAFNNSSRHRCHVWDNICGHGDQTGDFHTHCLLWPYRRFYPLFPVPAHALK